MARAMPPSSAEERIRQAWALRRAQRIEDCMRLVAELRHEHGVQTGVSGIAFPELTGDCASRKAEGMRLAEIALLSGSLARFQVGYAIVDLRV